MLPNRGHSDGTRLLPGSSPRRALAGTLLRCRWGLTPGRVRLQPASDVENTTCVGGYLFRSVAPLWEGSRSVAFS